MGIEKEMYSSMEKKCLRHGGERGKSTNLAREMLQRGAEKLRVFINMIFSENQSIRDIQHPPLPLGLEGLAVKGWLNYPYGNGSWR